MFYYKTEFCPFNLTEHDKSKCVYAHNWQDYRRKTDIYSYEPIVIIKSFSRASIGKQRNIYTSTTLDANQAPTVICVMAGKSSNTIRTSIKQLSAKYRVVRRDHAQTITLRKKEDPQIIKLLVEHSNMSPRIELLKECSRLTLIRKDSSQSQSINREPWQLLRY